MMAPKSCRSFLAYITGWLTTLGWQTSGASTGYLVATIIQGMVVMSRPTYIPKPWHTMLLMWAFMFFAVLVNSTTSRTLARFEGVVLIVHLIGFFCVLIPLVYLGPHANAPQVFTTFLNAGGWSSQQLSFFVGLPASAVTLLGGDSAIHVSILCPIPGPPVEAYTELLDVGRNSVCCDGDPQRSDVDGCHQRQSRLGNRNCDDVLHWRPRRCSTCSGNHILRLP